jgi:hypothetical protein
MAQAVLPFKNEEESREGGMTALAGLPLYLDLANVVGLRDSIKRHVKVRGGRAGLDGCSDGVIVRAIEFDRL